MYVQFFEKATLVFFYQPANSFRRGSRINGSEKNKQRKKLGQRSERNLILTIQRAPKTFLTSGRKMQRSENETRLTMGWG